MAHADDEPGDFASRAAIRASGWFASPVAFALAVATIVVWIVSGPFFKFSEAWQLVINTITMIVPFVMFFLIEHDKARRSKAVHAKVDALLDELRKNPRRKKERVHGRA